MPFNNPEDKAPKGITNTWGICEDCTHSKIEYGISNGSFWYYCHHCQEHKAGTRISTQ